MLNTATPFGSLEKQLEVERLMRRAKLLPRNWFGQQIAQIIRKRILRRANLPFDVCTDGLRLRVYLTDNNSEKKFVFMPWRFDELERKLLAEKLPADGVFVDIGANVGIYSIWAAVHLEERGTLVAFEPNPPAYARLMFNLEANKQAYEPGWPDVHCVQKGVSDSAGSFSLFLDPSNLGGSSLVLNEADEEEVQIECVTLFDYLSSIDVTRVDALKIDIEGAEERALVPFFRDAPSSLYPRLLIIESTHLDVQSSDLAKAIERANYRVLKKTKMNTIYALD